MLVVSPPAGVALSTSFALDCSGGWGAGGSPPPASYAFAVSTDGGATALQLAPTSASPVLANVSLPGGDVVLYCTALSADGAASSPATATVAVALPSFGNTTEADAFTASAVDAAFSAAASGDLVSAMQMVAGVAALMKSAGASLFPPPPPLPPPPPPSQGAPGDAAYPASTRVVYDAAAPPSRAPPPAPRSAQQVSRDAAAAAAVATLLDVIAAATPAAPTNQLELEAFLGLVRMPSLENFANLYFVPQVTTVLAVAPDASVAPLSRSAQGVALALVSTAVASCACGAIPVSPQAAAAVGASLSLLAAAAVGSMAQQAPAAILGGSPPLLPQPPPLPPHSTAGADPTRALRAAFAPPSCDALGGVASVLASFLDSLMDGLDVAGEAPACVAPPGGLFTASARLVAPFLTGPFASSPCGAPLSSPPGGGASFSASPLLPPAAAAAASPAVRVAVSTLAFDPWTCATGGATARLALGGGSAASSASPQQQQQQPLVFGTIQVGASALAAATTAGGAAVVCAMYSPASHAYDPSLCAALPNPAPVGATFSWAPLSRGGSNATSSASSLGWTASGAAFDGCRLLTLDCAAGDEALMITTPSPPLWQNYSLACAPGYGGLLAAWSGSACGVVAPSAPCAWDAARQRFAGAACALHPVLSVASRGAGDFIASASLAAPSPGVLSLVAAPPPSATGADDASGGHQTSALPPQPQPHGAPSKSPGAAVAAAARTSAPIAAAVAFLLLLLSCAIFRRRSSRVAAAAAAAAVSPAEWSVVGPLLPPRPHVPTARHPPDRETAPPHARRGVAPSGDWAAGASVAERLLALSGVSQPLQPVHVSGGHHHYFPPPLPPAADGGGRGASAGPSHHAAGSVFADAAAATSTTPRARRGSARELARLSSMGKAHKHAGGGDR